MDDIRYSRMRYHDIVVHILDNVVAGNCSFLPRNSCVEWIYKNRKTFQPDIFYQYNLQPLLFRLSILRWSLDTTVEVMKFIRKIKRLGLHYSNCLVRYHLSAAYSKWKKENTNTNKNLFIYQSELEKKTVQVRKKCILRYLIWKFSNYVSGSSCFTTGSWKKNIKATVLFSDKLRKRRRKWISIAFWLTNRTASGNTSHFMHFGW